jgi:hypothetical protein
VLRLPIASGHITPPNHPLIPSRAESDWISHSKCANGILSELRGSPQSCVPNVCQLCKTNLNSTALCMRSELCKLLIQGTLSQYGEPQATSAKKPKNGFVISRSPVRSRRVAPFKLPAFN